MATVLKVTNAETRLAELIWGNGPIASMELVRLAHSEIGRSKPTTFTYFRMLMEKGLAKNERSSVTMLFTRDEIVA